MLDIMIGTIMALIAAFIAIFLIIIVVNIAVFLKLRSIIPQSPGGEPSAPRHRAPGSKNAGR